LFEKTAATGTKMGLSAVDIGQVPSGECHFVLNPAVCPRLSPFVGRLRAVGVSRDCD
jgi:hypothetical protein